MTEPVVHCRHLLLCRSVWYDGQKPDFGIGLAGVYTRLSAGVGGFPFRRERMFIYAQLWGDDGEYYPYIRLVKIEAVGYD